MVRGLDVALVELGREALQRLSLFRGELDLALGGRLLQPQQPLVIGQQVVALPHSARAAGGDPDALETELLLDPHREASTACSIAADTRLGCGPFAPGRRLTSPSASYV